MDFATLAETETEDFVGSDCEIAGWGADESKRISGFFIHNTLRKVQKVLRFSGDVRK